MIVIYHLILYTHQNSYFKCVTYSACMSTTTHHSCNIVHSIKQLFWKWDKYEWGNHFPKYKFVWWIRGSTTCPSNIIVILVQNTFFCSHWGFFTLEFISLCLGNLSLCWYKHNIIMLNPDGAMFYDLFNIKSSIEIRFTEYKISMNHYYLRI